MRSTNPLIDLDPVDKESGHINAIIDTPKGSRNKFKFDEKVCLFKLGGALPVGAVFPFDFGYIPSTRAEDDDPLDILILMDEPAFVGCLVPARLIGVIEAEQTEDDETVRNDRLIAVAADSRNHSHVRFLGDLNKNLVHEIERFFISYNETKGKQFEILGRYGPERALAVINTGLKNFRNSRRRTKKSATKRTIKI
ncbi:MAG TPA: inorganic diphosphatase [Pyrinomonadaceae bacterium]|jgi:inorganic pyrophosphatase|nr:inorganic diphosphatase [Pyrinomonadaceae bacterium]